MKQGEAPTFTQFLRYYRSSNGDVGLVARFARGDGDWPKRARSLMTFEQHFSLLRKLGVPNVPDEIQLSNAYAEYRAFLRSGEPLTASKTPKRHILKYVALDKKSIKRLEELQDPKRRPDGRRMDRGALLDEAIADLHSKVFT
jgi:hypothetical protein